MAVGSSGGHVFPAFAVAEQLEEDFSKKFSKDSSLEIHFVHSGSKLGSELLSSGSYPVHTISIGGLAVGQRFLRKIKTLFQLPIAFFKSVLLIKKIKADVVFGTGGSATFPVLMAGFFMRKKIAIWEGNTSMGLANKALAIFTSQVFTVFPQVKGLSHKKQVWSAYPLRKQIQQTQTSEKPSVIQESLGQSNFPEKNKFKVLVLGGSQGSVFLNQAVSQALKEQEWRKDIFIYHQTGDKSFEELSQKYQLLEGVFAFAFSKDIQKYYKNCDLIFSRAGSGSVAEMAYCEKAVVLIPLTYSAGGHQLKNAKWLVSKNCVQMIEEKDFNAKAFQNKILELKQNPSQIKQMAQNLKSAYQADNKISSWLLDQLIK